MALSKVNFNSMNVTPAASKAIKFNSSNNGLETGDIDGSLVLISTQTASSSSTISFTSGIDSTYKEYQFHFTAAMNLSSLSPTDLAVGIDAAGSRAQVHQSGMVAAARDGNKVHLFHLRQQKK